MFTFFGIYYDHQTHHSFYYMSTYLIPFHQQSVSSKISKSQKFHGSYTISRTTYIMWNFLISVYTKLHILWLSLHHYFHNLLAPQNSPGRRTLFVYGDDYAVTFFFSFFIFFIFQKEISTLSLSLLMLLC